MKKNPVIPYAIIAVLGILTIIVLSIVGVNQKQDIADGGGEQAEQTVREPEEIVQSCIGCHGGELEGVGNAPALTNIGSKYSEEEIHDIIVNGIEGTAMPGGMATGEEAEVLAKWLAEKK